MQNKNRHARLVSAREDMTAETDTDLGKKLWFAHYCGLIYSYTSPESNILPNVMRDIIQFFLCCGVELTKHA